MEELEEEMKNTRLMQNTLIGEELEKWMRRKLREENFKEEEEKSMEDSELEKEI